MRHREERTALFAMKVDRCNTMIKQKQNKPTPCRFKITPVLTSLPSVSKTSKSRVMRYCVGATSCQMQFLFGGYSLGQPGLVIDPFSLVMKPPQAAGQETQHGKRQGQILSLQMEKCIQKNKYYNMQQCMFQMLCCKSYSQNESPLKSLSCVLNKPDYCLSWPWAL